MAIDVDKLATLRTLGSSLAEKELSDVNLLLHELGLEEITSNAWYGNDHWEPAPVDRATAVLERIRDLQRPDVDSLGEAVSRLYDVSIAAGSEELARPLFIFASHLATQKDFVGEVGHELDKWGIQLFVAHDSIEPDREWQQEIENALSTCHAGVAFLLPGFIDSRWCDQEIGWLLGRGVPCYALKFRGQDPYGPLGKKQARSVPDSMTAAHVAQAILDWLGTKPELKAYKYASLVEALKASPNFRTTDRIWELLHDAHGLQSAQVAGLLTAIRDNDQIYKAEGGVDGKFGPYKELILRLVTQQPGFEANLDLAREVAKLRGLERVLAESGVTDVGEGHVVWDEAPPF